MTAKEIKKSKSLPGEKVEKLPGAIGKVDVIQMNQNQGDFSAVENVFLYMGIPDSKCKYLGKVLAVSAKSDLDDLLGKDDSVLKTQLKAAISNSRNINWAAYILPYKEGDDWVKLFNAAMQKPVDLKIEALIFCEFAKDKEVIKKIHETMINAYVKYAKYICCAVAIEGIDVKTEDWPAYKTKIKAIIVGEAAFRVSPVPLLHGNNLGVVAGRLCDPAVTVADTPMRTATGALIGLGKDPVDKDSVPLNMADIEDLSKARFSVPQWYEGYDGMYFADMMMLDAEAGDFQVYENIRILDYLARRVRIQAITKIADRSLNSTPASISFHETEFGKVLRVASRGFKMGEKEVPGIIQPPEDGDIRITWKSRTEVIIAITAAPHDCPKKITVYIGLDLNRYNAG